MCGIFCKIGGEILSKKQIIKVTSSLEKRGPDSSDFYISGCKKIHIIHTRLAIQDETLAGNQPMISNDGRYIIAYNGEIYNKNYLRNYLNKKFNFKNTSNSDTEILFNGLIFEGKDFLEKVDGIYAFIFLDYLKKIIHLARDPLGIKPLVLSENDKFGLIFASDVNTILGLTKDKEISEKSLSDLLTLTFVPEPYTLFKNIYHVPAGKFYSYGFDKKLIIEEKINFRNFNLAKEKSYNFALKKTSELIKNGIISQTTSDVDMAVFMSSGIDSILIMENLKSKIYKIKKIFTLVWKAKANSHESQESEKNSAKRYINSKKLDKKHEFLSPPLTLRKYLDILKYLTIEGLSDPAALAMYELSKFTNQQKIKVALCGHGADELFYGYRRHIIFQYLEMFSKFPRISCDNLNNFKIKFKNPYLYLIFTRLIKLLSLFGNDIKENLFSLYTWIEQKDLKKLLKNYRVPTIKNEIDRQFLNKNISYKSLEDIDFKYDLVSLNLRYADRVGMFSSVEIRVPYLSLPLVNFVKSISSKYKVGLFKGKKILKNIAAKKLPNYVINRPKTSFTFPIRTLLFDDKEWVLLIFKKEDPFFEVYFNVDNVEKFINDYFNFKHHNDQSVFTLLQLKILFNSFQVS